MSVYAHSKTQNPKPKTPPYASILAWRSWTLDQVRWVLVAGMLAAFLMLAIGAHRVAAFAIDVQITRWVQAHDSTLLDWLTTASNWMMAGTPLSVFGIAIAVVLLARRQPLDAAVVAMAMTRMTTATALILRKCKRRRLASQTCTNAMPLITHCLCLSRRSGRRSWVCHRSRPRGLVLVLE